MRCARSIAPAGPLALRPVYVLQGRRWLPVSRAAALLATNTATVKRMMGDGRLEWCQNPAGTSLLVAEADVLRVRHAGNAMQREVARRAADATRTAAVRGRSLHDREPPRRWTTASIFEPTWDPSPLVLPISGRDPDDPAKR